MSREYRCIRLDEVDRYKGHIDWEEDAKRLGAWDEEDAAQDYVDERYSDWSYPRGPIEVLVLDVVANVTSVVEVTIEMAPTFHGNTREHGPNHCRHDPRWLSTIDGRCYGCGKVTW